MNKIIKIVLAASLILVMAPTSAEKLTEDQEARNKQILFQCIREIYPSQGTNGNGELVFYNTNTEGLMKCMRRKGYTHSDD